MRLFIGYKVFIALFNRYMELFNGYMPLITGMALGLRHTFISPLLTTCFVSFLLFLFKIEKDDIAVDFASFKFRQH